MMKQILTRMVLCLTLYACKNGAKEIPDGGPCTYDDKVYPAKLVKLEASPDSSTFNGWFEIDNPSGNGAKDTISYLRFTNRILSKEQVEKDSIRTGNIYKYVISTIRTGACNPDIRTIRLEKY
jgi:hypothetical protein